jgi:hypothetical protein
MVAHRHAARTAVRPKSHRSRDRPRSTVPCHEPTRFADRGRGTILVRGKYQELDVEPATLSVRHFVFTGAPNKLDMTGGVRTEAFAAKLADLRGATLTSPLAVQLGKDGTISLSRTGPGVSMKITGKDCASGGIFQMEPERADGTATTFTHVLGAGAFYFNNPNFAAAGSPRVNFANDVSRNFVGRDSPQVATKLSQTATTTTWSVQSGGRMGQVMGEDAVELAPAASTCTHQCGAQNQVKGEAPVLGFPWPVPAAARIL